MHSLVTVGAQHQGVMAVPGCLQGGDANSTLYCRIMQARTAAWAVGPPPCLRPCGLDGPGSGASSHSAGACACGLQRWHLEVVPGVVAASLASLARLLAAPRARGCVQGLIGRGAYSWLVQGHVVQAQYVKARRRPVRAGHAAQAAALPASRPRAKPSSKLAGLLADVLCP